ncbi:MAG TPA: 1-(5-phosphoribosyl)-5-[(5-phosphoribosylamino)methylideneamino]imidazole-4-carboxamide isomerase [Candidatus Sumerlaeota bacterium]|nr:1-(5-phosphoribosyl)-5-[(5-phosphoribosylamino)methylideneamino]imidazole-4-carboxamide isomerase [Candidatus Sumerlaeota bacterium]HPK02641.1 1-(5-phosphoribosyl)-5-[(5-phosphoribosylamino)methylideneamino]imidazole-4-carboxamide isomerase [Candidatus Sumerlaeota bacterium]
MFLPIPAIDLMNGQVVRLSRGRAQEKTVYSDDPVAVARQFEALGARRLHVVDLDGAFTGQPRNLEILRRIREATALQIEMGGGLRTRDLVERVLGLGLDFAILGTSALRDRALIAGLAADYGDKLIVGIDAKDGRVAIEGWVETSELTAIDFARELQAMGVGTVIYTDIATDGMLSGPNLSAQAEMADAVAMRVIASGGIRDVADLRALRDLNRPNLIGAITGRAVYEQRLSIAEAVQAMAEANGASRP